MTTDVPGFDVDSACRTEVFGPIFAEIQRGVDYLDGPDLTQTAKLQSRREKRGVRRVRRAGLQYVQSMDKGWVRRRCGKGFTYHAANGKRLTGSRTLKRIDSLAIPPAWDEVHICPDRDGHIQAVGRDAAGRLQYIYHPDWINVSSTSKFDRMATFGSLLPKIRGRLRRDLAKAKLSKEKVVAAVVRLIDKAHIRVGNTKYTVENGSHGATTLTAAHVDTDDLVISLDYPGKSGQRIELSVNDSKVSEVIRECEEIGGQYLFSIRDEAGQYQPVGSSDVNDYLRSVAGENLTAKDFRTWWGSVIALQHLRWALADNNDLPAKKLLAAAIANTAGALGHTKAVCRQSYIHPGLISAVELGKLSGLLEKFKRAEESPRAGLTRNEDMFLAILPALKQVSSV